MRATVCGVLLACAALAASPQGPSTATPAASPIFVFDRPFWLNLHHFLYVLGRAEAKTSDTQRRAVSGAPAEQASGLATLTESERSAWGTAVTFYAGGLSKKDAVFDEELVQTGRVLADAGDRRSLDGLPLDAALIATLTRVAPVYRKAWWPQHDAANRALVDELHGLLAKHGQAVLTYITRAYREAWPPGGFRVHMTAYANWAGAFSTTAGFIVVSSRNPAATGLSSLESVFHEAMHQWDDSVQAALTAEARRQGTRVPPNLSHAMIFFTAGEAVRRISPTHVPLAESEGVWGRGMGVFKPALEAVWKPYLAGEGTRDEALAALIKAAAPRKPGLAGRDFSPANGRHGTTLSFQP
jgi:hypothetical protein